MNTIRRSARRKIPTERALQFRNTMSNDDRNFPSSGDMIAVQWEIDGKKLWWPADVLFVDSTSSSTESAERHGRIRYRAYREYRSEEAKVVFTIQGNSSSRFVSVINNRQTQIRSNTCSWTFLNGLSHAEQLDFTSNNLYSSSEEFNVQHATSSISNVNHQHQTISPRMSRQQHPHKSSSPSSGSSVSRE